jgi:hypothetical protein
VPFSIKINEHILTKILLILSILFIYPLTVFCQQTYTLSGRIVDNGSNEIIAGAEVSSESQKVKVGRNGHYQITLYAGLNRIMIRYDHQSARKQRAWF